MTEKRFKHKRNQLGMQFICYDDKAELLGTFADAEGVNNIVELLNELYEENRLLELEDERWVKASEHDQEVIDRLRKENEQLKKDLIDHSALISMLEDYQALKIEETLWNLTGAKSEEEFNELYKPYLEKAKRCYK